MASARQDAQKHRSLERAEEVMRLRVEKNMSFREIAKELDISPKWAHSLWHKWMSKRVEELHGIADEMRVEELARLDALWELNFTRATNRNEDPDVQQKATDRCLKISAERRKLLGLDMPDRLEVTGKDGGPLAFDLSGIEGDVLEAELAGFFQPGFPDDVLDSFLAGVAAGEEREKQRRKDAAPARAKRHGRRTKPQAEQAEQEQPEGKQAEGSGEKFTLKSSQGKARV